MSNGFIMVGVLSGGYSLFSVGCLTGVGVCGIIISSTNRNLAGVNELKMCIRDSLKTVPMTNQSGRHTLLNRFQKMMAAADGSLSTMIFMKIIQKYYLVRWNVIKIE